MEHVSNDMNENYHRMMLLLLSASIRMDEAKKSFKVKSLTYIVSPYDFVCWWISFDHTLKVNVISLFDVVRV